MRYSILTLLLLVPIVCLSIALWMEHNKQPEVFYLHLYSNRYDIHSMRSDLAPPPRDFQCIATLSVSPGVPFYAQLPNHYEPEIMIHGSIDRRDTSIETNFTIDLQDVGLAISHHQNKPIKFDDIIEFWDGEFRLAISKSDTPP